MPLSWNEIKDRAIKFSREWAEEASEPPAAGCRVPKLGTDAKRVAVLFERHQALTSLLPSTKAKKLHRKRATEEVQ